MADETPPPPAPGPQMPNLWPIFVQFLAWFFQSTWLKVVICTMLTFLLFAFTLRTLIGLAMPNFTPPDIHKILPPKRKAEDAIGRIQFGNAGCTATVIGPVGPNDTKLDILTAAHCVKVGGVGKMLLKNGTTLAVQCVARDPASDAAWLVADHPGGDVAFLLLADAPPQDGEVVWHQGYGIDRPGNRESGVFRGTAPGALQCKFRLSVSPGDSGGGIILDSDSRVISPVCCTTKLAGTGDVWGANPVASARIRPKHSASEEEPPKIWPVLPMPEQVFERPTPMSGPKLTRPVGDK